MKTLKPVQVLTEESILKIRRAIIFAEVVNDTLPGMPTAEKVIKELNEVLTEVNED